MSTTISFWVPGKPVAKARARSTRTGHHYTPEKTRIYEEKVALFASQEMKGRPLLEGPVELYLTFMFEHPKSHYRTGKHKGTLKAQYAERTDIRHAISIDSSNLLKAVEDGCNRIVWKDDCQVWYLVVRKIYGDREGVNVTITAEE